MQDDHITNFAYTTFRNHNQRFGIKQDDRRRHMYLIGKTGMGKSTVLENMIVDDIWAGNGVAVVDPHGDLAEKIMDYIPNSRINDVIYFNPADFNYPIAFNVVEHVEPEYRHLVASGLISVFQKLWADSWGPRLEYILRNTILAVLDYPGSTLLAVTRMLSDKKFRKKVIDKVQDPVVKAFWVTEFSNYANNFATEAVSPIQNKVGQFLSTSLIRNIIGQVKSSLDMRQIMDEGKIVIMNLSKGRIGEDSSALLGAMMITKIQLAAMSRVNTPEQERKDFFLYIDEFQNFTTESFANILSEARKYRLNIIMAHQYIEQLGDTVKAAVFGNVGTIICFRVGAADAEELIPEFTPTFMAEDLVNIPKYEMYLKLMIDGIASDPFSAHGLPPLTEEQKTGNLDKVIRISRERYAKEKSVVEDKIRRWAEGGGDEDNGSKAAPPPPNRPRIVLSEKVPQTESPANPPAPRAPEPETKEPEPKKAPPDSVYRYEADCSRCGQETKTSFKPDGVRPVYCKDCLSKVREEKKSDLDKRKALKEAERERFSNIVLPTERGTRKNKPETKPPKAERIKPPAIPGDEPAEEPEADLSLSEVMDTPPVVFKSKTSAPIQEQPEPKGDSSAGAELNEGEPIEFS